MTDVEGITHGVEVSASSLYEGVALGLRAIRKSEWADEIPKGLNNVRVSVTGKSVEHTVQMKTFNQSLERVEGSPAVIMQRKKVRDLLGG